MILITAALGTISLLLYLYWIKPFLRFWKMVNMFPGKKTYYPFGDIFNFSPEPESLFRQIRQYNKEFPEGFRITVINEAGINLNTPADAEVILSSMKYINKSWLYNFLHPWLKSGLLTSKGTHWQYRRKLLTTAFHFNILRRFVDVFGEHGKTVVDELKKECMKNETNLVPLISKLTLSIICETAMGVTMHSENEDQVNYRKTISRLSDLLLERLCKPWLFYDTVYNLSRSSRTQKEYLKVLHEFTSNIIKERELSFKGEDLDTINKEDEEGNVYRKKRLAMLDLLISAKRKGEIDDAGIREEVDTFMFEGHDTTSIAICFALLRIANNKHIQDKLVEEIYGIFKGSDRQATYQDLQNMQYLELCLKETLRLHPSVHFISREANEDIPLRGKYVIPKGSMIHIHIYDIHRNPKIYPDPEKFDPERFLPENTANRHPYAYIPFSAGARNCIGQKFAMLEMKSVISSILRYYEMEPVDKPEDIVIAAGLVLRPKEGIFVKFKPRTHK